MKFYSFDKELVDAAILFDVHFKSEKIRVMPAFGEFIQRDGGLVFLMEPILKDEETMEFPVSFPDDVTIEELNSENTMINVLSTKGKESFYQLLIVNDEDEEKAKEKMDQMLIQHYIKTNKLTSKKKVEKLIDSYFEDFPIGSF